jgi:hypothetical protein
MRLTHVLTCIAMLLPAIAVAAPAHVHGAAKMDLSVEGDRLMLSLEMPLNNTLGFEHLPRTEKEKAALVATIKILKNAADLFVPTAAAACKSESVEVSDPFPGGKAKADGHADMDGNYVFRCAQPAALKSVETTLFRHFSRLKRIDVQRATPSGQGAARLSPEQPKLNW